MEPHPTSFNDPSNEIISFPDLTEESEETQEKSPTVHKIDIQSIKSIPGVGLIDPLLISVAEKAVVNQSCDINFILRYFCIGYNRGSRIIDQLEKINIVKRQDNKKLVVLVKDLESLEKLLIACISSEYSDDITSSPINRLNQLIGLANVKSEISSLSNLVKVQQVRKERGMPVSNLSYHCVFTGNPGTGKTTVARIVADIYKDLGVLKKGQLIETDRSGLVGEYVGQTAPKTNAIIDSAMDGVLFIDEAYSLVQGGQGDYGLEAISTLLKRMEDDRDRLVVILAGYSKEMNDFINSNSGLQSRFNRYIEFPDYSSEELKQIFDFIIKDNALILTDEASNRIKDVIENAVATKDSNFGNARYIRNLFEKVITQQANRIAKAENITNELLSEIEAIDVINATS